MISTLGGTHIPAKTKILVQCARLRIRADGCDLPLHRINGQMFGTQQCFGMHGRGNHHGIKHFAINHPMAVFIPHRQFCDLYPETAFNVVGICAAEFARRHRPAIRQQNPAIIIHLHMIFMPAPVFICAGKTVALSIIRCDMQITARLKINIMLFGYCRQRPVRHGERAAIKIGFGTAVRGKTRIIQADIIARRSGGQRLFLFKQHRR